MASLWRHYVLFWPNIVEIKLPIFVLISMRNKKFDKKQIFVSRRNQDKKLVKRENPSWFHSYIFQGLVLLSMSRWFHTKFPAHRKQNKNDFLHFGQFLTVERDSPPRKLLSSGLKYEFSEAWCKSWLNLKYLKMFLTSFDLIWPQKWPFSTF